VKHITGASSKSAHLWDLKIFSNINCVCTHFL
jgi:hypothetical protein